MAPNICPIITLGNIIRGDHRHFGLNLPFFRGQRGGEWLIDDDKQLYNRRRESSLTSLPSSPANIISGISVTKLLSRDPVIRTHTYIHRLTQNSRLPDSFLVTINRLHISNVHIHSQSWLPICVYLQAYTCTRACVSYSYGVLKKILSLKIFSFCHLGKWAWLRFFQDPIVYTLMVVHIPTATCM